MTRHRAAFSLVQPDQPTPGTLPDGHLDRINALQAKKGKPALRASDLIARPIRLFGNELTSYSTRIPDADLQTLANQINAGGTALLSAHVTDDTPIGTFYAAVITQGDAVAVPDLGQPSQLLYLDTWAYWLNDDTGQDLVRRIDGGIINEASICYWYDQVICSITGGSYWDSPYWAGRTYDIIDPQTGQSTTQLCFLWTTGNVEVAEGSLVYRGAYPGTRVGGSPPDTAPLLSANAAAPTGPVTLTRFQLAASRDMSGVVEKKALAAGQGAPPTPPSTADTKGEAMKLSLKLPDGSVKEIESTDAQALLDGQITAAYARGQQSQLEAHATALGLEPKDATGDRLQALKLQAEDGAQYRTDLLADLEKLALAVNGTDEAGRAAAARAKKAFGTLELSDIRDEVKRLEALRDAGLPNARLSDDRPAPTDAKPAPANLDAV